MDKCPVCGRENPIEEANFCYYCGAGFREVPPTTERAEYTPMTDEEREIVEGKSFSTLKWLLCFVLIMIPIYGWMAFLVIMALGAFGQSSTPERKSMSKALLIFMVGVIAFFVISTAMLWDTPEFQEALNEAMKAAGGTAQTIGL